MRTSRHGKVAILQVLRAVAALLVTQAHVVNIATAHHTRAQQASFRQFSVLGSAGVDMFFAISGFIIPIAAANTTGSRNQFLLRRIVRIYPLWWCALGLWFLVAAVLHWNAGSWRHLLWSALLLPNQNKYNEPAIYLGWTLIFEMFFYSTIYLAWGKKPWTRPWRALFAAGVLGGVGVIAHPSFPLSHIFTNPILLEFGLGILIGLVWTSGRTPPMWVAAVMLAAGIVWLLSSGYAGFGAIYRIENTVSGELSASRVLLWGVPCALIVFGGLMLSPKCSSPLGTVFVALGNASYSIYLSSVFTGIVLFEAWRFLSWMPGDLLIAAGVAVVAAIGFGCYRIVELPISRKLNRMLFGTF